MSFIKGGGKYIILAAVLLTLISAVVVKYCPHYPDAVCTNGFPLALYSSGGFTGETSIHFVAALLDIVFYTVIVWSVCLLYRRLRRN